MIDNDAKQLPKIHETDADLDRNMERGKQAERAREEALQEVEVIRRIAAKDVVPGVYIWNSLAYHPSAAWVRVTDVHKTDRAVSIETDVYTTLRYPEEGIGIQLRGVRAADKDKPTEELLNAFAR